MDRISAAVSRAKKQRDSALGTEPAPAKTGARRTTTATSPEPEALAELPLLTFDREFASRHKIFAFDENDPRTPRIDILRTQVLQGMAAMGLQTVGVTSPSSACGKTVIALNLAMSMARQTNHRVLLVDFDLKKPAVAKYLGIAGGVGLEAYLAGRESLDAIMRRLEPGQLTLLPTFARVPASTEIIMSEPVKTMVTQLKETHPGAIIVFDLPPLLETDDTIAFLPNLDCSLLVVAEGMSTPGQVEECSELLQSSHNLGVVYNKSSTMDRSYYGYARY